MKVLLEDVLKMSEGNKVFLLLQTHVEYFDRNIKIQGLLTYLLTFLRAQEHVMLLQFIFVPLKLRTVQSPECQVWDLRLEFNKAAYDKKSLKWV